MGIRWLAIKLGRSLGWNLANLKLKLDGKYYVLYTGSNYIADTISPIPAGNYITYKGLIWKEVSFRIITEGEECTPWKETFIIWPRLSINDKKLFWQKVFKRRVWIVWGTTYDMETQYATAFDLLTYDINSTITI